MKRLITLAIMVAFILGGFGVAQAIEFKAKGDWQIGVMGVSNPGFDEDEDARGAAITGLHKRVEAVVPQIRADRQRVAMPGTGASQVGGGVGFCRRADVVPLGIEHHQQAGVDRVVDHLGEGDRACRAELFEERGLRLDDRHQVGDRIDDPFAEPPVAFRDRRVVGAGRWGQADRKLLCTWVEPDADGRIALANRLAKSICPRLGRGRLGRRYSGLIRHRMSTERGGGQI